MRYSKSDFKMLKGKTVTLQVVDYGEDAKVKMVDYGEDVSFEKKEEEGVLLVKLIYTIVRTNNRSNMVYPFYLNEGTNLNNIDM